MKRLYILTFCTLVVATSIFLFKKRNPTTISQGEGLVVKKEWLQVNKNSITKKEDCRPADQTFLTFPEWYLVFSPEEQADYFKHTTATSFPFISHTRQIWESYHIVNNQIKGNFPVNKGYHFMIWVIGTSASIEYSIKSWYETIFGRMTDTENVVTDEDKFNAKFTQEYVTFIKDRPWYEFDFKNQLKNLWCDTSFFGNNFIRKAERKYIITSELFVKWGYSKLIGMGTEQVYDEALPTTTVVTNDNEIVNLPRYDKFNEAITKLALKGKSFKEIAGNNSAILLTVIVPNSNLEKFKNTQPIFIQPLSSNPTHKRITLTVQICNLNKLLLTFNSKKIKVEHVFDY